MRTRYSAFPPIHRSRSSREHTTHHVDDAAPNGSARPVVTLRVSLIPWPPITAASWSRGRPCYAAPKRPDHARPSRLQAKPWTGIEEEQGNNQDGKHDRPLQPGPKLVQRSVVDHDLLEKLVGRRQRIRPLEELSHQPLLGLPGKERRE